MKAFLVLLFSIAILSASKPAMLGIKINEPEESLSSLNLKILSRQDNTTKFKTLDGNHFSVTTENGKVVFMENDWLHDNAANKPLLTSFVFGETTLKDIRTAFGTTGYSYRDNSYLKSETVLATINCFELDTPDNEVLVMITKAPIKSITDKEKVPDFLKLDAIILSDKNYLDKLWGKKKYYDPNGYKKIQL